jgi:hypothetical protein
LKAWFGADGVTVQPTLPDAERGQTWNVGFHLKGYGYGRDLVDSLPIVSRKVSDNRIEYEHAVNSKSEIENRNFIEWYENRPGGIEQGFTLNAPPVRSEPSAPNESLRVLLTVSGDLRAQIVQDGNQVELTDATGKATLSYRKLVALDADGKKLAARMKVGAEGREIALVVDDSAARYPVMIDPLIATLEQKLGSDIPQTDARFGIAVAIDGNLAVVGACREDVGPNPDVGAVYVFVRSGSTWTLDKRFGSSSGAGQQCGLSVAVRGNRIAFGCPGENNGAGTALALQRNCPNDYTALALTPVPAPHAGDQFGASVAISATFFRSYRARLPRLRRRAVL